MQTTMVGGGCWGEKVKMKMHEKKNEKGGEENVESCIING